MTSDERPSRHHVTLTAAEAELLKSIDLRASHNSHSEGRAAYLANQKPILELVKSLSARNAIPTQRIRFWNDQEYNPGRIKSSRKGLFERNGCHGSEIYAHPHFISYLRYFLFGAELPERVIEAFESVVGDPAYVTSGDVVPICKAARELTRRHRLDPSDAPEEFFKLSLDLGLSLSIASAVMRSVKQVR
jgi:hypothetical protein